MAADHSNAEVGNKVRRATLPTVRAKLEVEEEAWSHVTESTDDTTVRDATKSSGFKVTADGAI